MRAIWRRHKDIIDLAAFSALEMAMRRAVRIVAQEAVAKIQRNRQVIFEQQFQCIVDRRARKRRVFWQKRHINFIDRRVRLDTPQVAIDKDPL